MTRSTRAAARASVRNAIVGGCLFGAALGTVGAITHFAVPRHTASPAHVECNASAGGSVLQRSVLAANSPATPFAAPTEGPHALEAEPLSTPPTPALTPRTTPHAVMGEARTASSPALPAPARRSASSPGLTTHASTQTPLPAKSLAGALDRTQESPARLASKNSSSASAEPPAKPHNRRKAIHGD